MNVQEQEHKRKSACEIAEMQFRALLRRKPDSLADMGDSPAKAHVTKRIEKMDQENKIMAKLYGVGVGSGDPELLTLKAVRLIHESDVIAVPSETAEDAVAYRIVKKVIPEIAEKEILGIKMLMIKDKKELKTMHEQAARRIIDKLDAGKQVAFLTLGDPTIYSTFVYIQDIVKKEGYETELVNGIASFLSASARINRRLVLRDEELHIIPATYGIHEALALKGTKVFMKAGKRMREVKELIVGSGQKAYFIENCGMENERIIEDVTQMPDCAGYYSLLIVYDCGVIG